MAGTHQTAEIQPGQVGDDGKVRVYDIPASKWKRVAPVDAREMIVAGTASFHGPDVELVGPAGRVKVCEVQVHEYLNKGFKHIEPEVTNASNGNGNNSQSNKDGDDDEKKSPHDFSKYKVEELRAFCDQAELNHHGMNKAQMIALLNDAEFDPDEDENDSTGE